MARLVTLSDEDMAYAARRIAEGYLVGFPTETVYGLGANALNGDAAEKVFHVKGRPPTDPLIVHVVDYEAAFRTLWALTDEATISTARVLARALWPGPLTLVATAAAIVPRSVTGGSGFVGLRVPDHPVAQRLIRESGCPIAAPSANLFGHVSPTTARHVMDDLADRDATLTVIDGGECSIGIESTVIKLVSSDQLEIIRRGKCSADDVLGALVAAGLTGVKLTVRDTRSKYLKHDTTEAMDAPGQLLTHYAPRVPTFLLTPASLQQLRLGSSDAIATGKGDRGSAWELVLPGGAVVPSTRVLVIDFGNLLGWLISAGSSDGAASAVLASLSLSTTGNEDEACRAIFNALRWSETVDGAEALCVPMITEFYASQAQAELAGRTLTTQSSSTAAASASTGVSLLEAVEDRLFRAASGRMAVLRRVEA